MEEEPPPPTPFIGVIRRILFNEEGHFPTIMGAFEEGNLLYRLCHLAFLGAIVLAIVVIVQRRPRPWCLITSMLPPLVAGFAYHFRWLALFQQKFAPRSEEWFDGTMLQIPSPIPAGSPPPLPDFTSTQPMFVYDVRFFWWALIAWFALSALSLCFGRSLPPSESPDMPAV